MRSDHFSLSFERTTDLGAFHGAGVIEREGCEWRKEDIELEGRSFERKPLFELALRPAAELWHRARDAVKEALRPTVLIDV